MSTPVDIIVCVHNSLDDVKRCLAAIIEKTLHYRVIVVDDGSDDETRSFLESWCSNNDGTLLRNPTAQGYTKAANRGLRASSAEFAVLLNSDTIVSNDWLSSMLACAHSDPRIGLVGPLSNAASWQSVPDRYAPNGDWAVNELPQHVDVDTYADVVRQVSVREYPRVPLLNGFCLLIRRSVLEETGYLDEAAFPHGYGEENDLCLRASDAGYALVIADDAYVYHAKSKSYSHERRRTLSRAGGIALVQKHGRAKIETAQAHIKQDVTLDRMRTYLKRINWGDSLKDRSNAQMSVLFLLPSGGGGGGSHSVVQEAAGMRYFGVHSSVAVPRRFISRFRREYANLAPWNDFFLPFNDAAELSEPAGKSHVVVATMFESVLDARRLAAVSRGTFLAYYVQDYEPWFHDASSPKHDIAAKSYMLAKDGVLFAKTDWLQKIVFERHGVQVQKVRPSIDTTVYYPSTTPRTGRRVSIVAMVRPFTKRRCASETMQVLKECWKRFGDRVDLHIFGCRWYDPRYLRLDRQFRFTHHGYLRREGVASLLRQSDVFLDMSRWQAFGRTGLEAMACGATAVLPKQGGVFEYAVDGLNSLIVDTSNLSDCVDALSNIVEDHNLLSKLKTEAKETAKHYSIAFAALSEINLFVSEWNKRNRSLAINESIYPKWRGDGRTNDVSPATYQLSEVH